MESGCFNGTYNKDDELHTTSSGTKQCEMSHKREPSSKGASFIKVLGRDFSKQLQLPEDFTVNMNGYMPHRFIIESGITKKCWRVEVKKDGDGRMYFHDGWGEFVEAHFLEVGNFLLFEYEEQSIFQVRIYGRNGCERTTLLDRSKGCGHKAQKTNNDEGGEDVEALEFEPVIVKCRKPKTRRLAPRKYGKNIREMRHAVPRSYTRTAKISATGNKTYFSITMHHYKKHQFTQLTIPMAISLKMKLPNKDKVKLQDDQGNYWNVKLAHRSDGRALLAQGWTKFLKDNKVAPQDKLLIEFISEDVVQVIVTKSSKVEHEPNEATDSFNAVYEHEKPSRTRASKHKAVETPKTLKRIIFCESENSFTFMWRESCNRTYLHIPMAIVQAQNLMKKDNIVLRDPEGKCWPLEVKQLTGNRVAFAKGWVEFWRGYGFTSGDVLNFIFVSENLIQVSIKKAEKPPLEPEAEDDIIRLDAMDTEEAAIIEPEVDISREGCDASIKLGTEVDISREGCDASIELGTEVTQEDYDVVVTPPGTNDAIN